jgi:hypothetical protein
MRLNWYARTSRSAAKSLLFIRRSVTESSIWRFCRARFGPLKGLDAGVSLKEGPRLRLRRRRRALTLRFPEPSTPGRSVTKQPWTADQTQSRFLAKLPEDVRVLVYESILGGKGFHLSCSQARSPPDCFICHKKTMLLGPDTRRVCNVKTKKDLLPFLFTCRQVYSEAIHILYAANAFYFTESFCLRNFMNALPTHRLRSIRRLRFMMHLRRSPTLNARTWNDWEDFWMFFPERFSGLTLLRIDLGFDFAMARRICGQTVEDVEWLLPVVRIVTGAGQDEGTGSGLAIEQRTLCVGVAGIDSNWPMVNVNKARQQAKELLEPAHSNTELDAVTCRSLHNQLQALIRCWLQRYGR